MPRIRTIKPEFWSDEKLAPLDPVDRLTFLGLISLADDFGRVHDNCKVIDAFVFPECSRTVRESLANLSRIGRIRRGNASSGKRIIEIVNWSKHQRVDKPQTATALPEIAECTDETLENAGEKPIREPFANHSGTVRDPLATLSGIRDQGSGTRDQGNNSCSELAAPASKPAPSDRSPVFNCAGNRKQWQATDEQIDGWIEAYPAVDVLAEMKRAKVWIDSNPVKKKTASGMARYINAWLSKSQNNPDSVSANGRYDPFATSQPIRKRVPSKQELGF